MFQKIWVEGSVFLCYNTIQNTENRGTEIKMKFNRVKQVLLFSFCLITLLAGCGNKPSEQNNTSADSPEENVEATEIPDNPESEALESIQTDNKGTKTIYEGIYFDESFYQYIDMPIEESPLIYCEITISNVTDSSFDFVIEEKVMATGESSVLIPAATAVIEEAGSKAVYKGDSLTLTFSFPDDQDTFPQRLEISGFEKLENKVYINNTIPGHESG